MSIALSKLTLLIIIGIEPAAAESLLLLNSMGTTCASSTEWRASEDSSHVWSSSDSLRCYNLCDKKLINSVSNCNSCHKQYCSICIHVQFARLVNPSKKWICQRCSPEAKDTPYIRTIPPSPKSICDMPTKNSTGMSPNYFIL